jgi:signal transduction histidine kinase
MTPAEIGPSARDDSGASEPPGGSRAFESSPFTLILEAVPFGLFVLDAKGSPVYSNSRASEILGRDLPHDTLPSRLAEEYSAYLAGTDAHYPVERMPVVRALSGEISTVTDVEIRRPAGSVFLEVSGAPVLDADKRVKYAVAVFRDVTATRSLEAALRQLADELSASANERYEQLESLKRGLGHPGEAAQPRGANGQQPGERFEPCADCIVLKEAEAAKASAALASRALSLFIANFSHELRTPLNHIMGFSDLI